MQNNINIIVDEIVKIKPIIYECINKILLVKLLGFQGLYLKKFYLVQLLTKKKNKKLTQVTKILWLGFYWLCKLS